MIDSHQHFWKLERGDYGWLTEDMEVLYRNYLPEDLVPMLEQFNISGTIVVQAAPTYEETQFLLSLYERYEWIKGVVGWLDLSSPSFPEQLEKLLKNPGVVGLRPMLQDIEQSDWILQEKVVENVKILHQKGLLLDLLINKKHIPFVLELLKALPDLRAVVDHMAKPNIAQGELSGWKEDMKSLAEYPNVWCKVSGFMTEAVPYEWRTEDFNPYIQHVAKVFGPSRLLFGSDWPVCLSAGSYGDTIDIINKNLPDSLTTDERERIFTENAKKFYRLNTTTEESLR
ncbi:amidohydrolase family protein [Fictibacillus fluitans]|uniref:Amidohydrolase family protein n=1 Tax=Fictibacillus fluitans TaxID=3058422 RepID=A0ABT8HWC3_9BACL|nr:amidohydrolase family protein [Fictibacillus sp. NE201]MDN4525078.1 amidohydrolase family protein [Fictibacillus sp. NE201]